jgi:F5/8 type C domain-containing protein
MSFGNNGGIVTPADVARVRAEVADRKMPWTVAELEASLPHLLDSAQWKITASHAAETAAGAATLRGWSTGAPQTAGMWLTVELAQPALIDELQFESTASGGGRSGRGRFGGPGGRGAAPGAAPGAPAPVPVVGYPRGYTVQVSMDGNSWSPVAEGKGDGARTTVAFRPTRAKFVRITQTDSVPDAAPWSVRNLRIYEAPAAAAAKR